MARDESPTDSSNSRVIPDRPSLEPVTPPTGDRDRRFPRSPTGARLSSRRSRILVGAPAVAVLLGALSSVAAVGAPVGPLRNSAEAVTTSAGSSPTPAPDNLLVGRQASFNGTTGGWTAADASLSWTSKSATGSSGSLEVTSSTGRADSAWSGSPSTGSLTPADPGTLYTATASVITGGPSLTVADVLAFFDSAGAYLTWVWSQGSTVTSSAWSSLPTVAAIAPPSAASVALGVVAYTSSVGERIFIDDPYLGDPPVSHSPPLVGPLLTSGNQILDAHGRPVTLRGVVLNGLESNPAAPGITYQAVLQAKVWGANFIRVPLGEQFWLSSNCNYKATYRTTIDNVVNWITSLGMVALLDLHFNTLNGCTPGGPHDMADETQAPTFWRQVATRYQSNPLVAFDLYNEPHNISDAVWLNGGITIDTTSLQLYQAAGMQQLYDVVRSTGADNLVFISGNNWANTVPSVLVTGNNIVYEAHVYTCPVVAPPACSSPNPYDPSKILDDWVAVGRSVPVMVTEFGWPSAYDGTYNENVICFANAHGWGWSAFTWQPASTKPWSLVIQSPATGPYEPTPAGIPVLLGLSGIS